MKDIAGIRREYAQTMLLEKDVRADPIDQFRVWWEEAVSAAIDEVNAMHLSTATAEGVPWGRVVLLKGFDQRGFVFFTNYHSIKGRQLEENPKACLLFFWKELERQVRVLGLIEKLTAGENDHYFHSRPVESQLAALVSPQSEAIESRDWLDARYREQQETLSGQRVPRPPHWGGYRVRPVIMEFWQGRMNRLHDRLQYSLGDDGTWKMERLAP